MHTYTPPLCQEMTLLQLERQKHLPPPELLAYSWTSAGEVQRTYTINMYDDMKSNSFHSADMYIKKYKKIRRGVRCKNVKY